MHKKAIRKPKNTSKIVLQLLSSHAPGISPDVIEMKFLPVQV